MESYLGSLMKHVPPSLDHAVPYMAFLLLPILLLLLGKIYTRLQSRSHSHNDDSTKAPPQPSWGLQGLGHLLSLTLQPESFLRRLTYVEDPLLQSYSTSYYWIHRCLPALTVVASPHR
jgi:hypothetical protein